MSVLAWIGLGLAAWLVPAAFALALCRAAAIADLLSQEAIRKASLNDARPLPGARISTRSAVDGESTG